MNENKTHYRKAFDSPYLSSADIVEPTILTISHVKLESDKTKKTKDVFNTAYFVEKELRPGEALKPMILNAGNSRTMKQLTGSPFIEDWVNQTVTVYVDNNVRFGKDTVEGLRISTERPRQIAMCTTEQVEEIENEVKETSSDMEKFLKVLGIAGLHQLNSATYVKAKQMLAMKRKQMSQSKTGGES